MTANQINRWTSQPATTKRTRTASRQPQPAKPISERKMFSQRPPTAKPTSNQPKQPARTASQGKDPGQPATRRSSQPNGYQPSSQPERWPKWLKNTGRKMGSGRVRDSWLSWPVSAGTRRPRSSKRPSRPTSYRSAKQMVDGRPVNQKNREGETDRKKNREREGKTSPAQVEGDREGKESSPTSPGEVERVAMEIREREGVLPGRRRLSGETGCSDWTARKVLKELRAKKTG